MASLDHNAPFSSTFSRWCRQWQAEQRQSSTLRCQDLPVEDQALWHEHLPEHLLWLPLRTAQGETSLALILARETPWLAPEILLLDTLAEPYAHAWSSLHKQRRPWADTPEKTPHDAVWHRSIGVNHADPGAPIRAGPGRDCGASTGDGACACRWRGRRYSGAPNQPLARLDARELEKRLEAARKTFATTDAQYRQAQQQALFDANSKASLAVLQSRREQAQSERDFLLRQLERMQLTSPRDGVAVFDDASEWIGRSVAVGERIMMVADPKDVELEIQLPAADAIALEIGADVRLFLNIAPNAAQEAQLTQIGYRAALTPDNVMAYRLRARFTEDDAQRRVGLKGTAKLYGKRTLLVAYLLRKPLATLRVWLGV